MKPVTTIFLLMIAIVTPFAQAQQYVYSPASIPQPFQYDQTAAIKDGTLRLKAQNPQEYAWLVAGIPAGEYDLTLTSSLYLGASGPATVAVRLSRGGPAIATFEMMTQPEQEYKARVVFTAANPVLYMSITNTVVNPNDETRIRVRNVILDMVGGPEPTGGKALVSWAPNAEPDIAGYRLYFGKSQDDVTMHNTGPDTSHLVENLEEGATYFFKLTAYDLNGNESDFSDEVSYTVPVPTVNPRIVFEWPTEGFVLHDDSLTVTYNVTGDTSFIAFQEFFVDGVTQGIALKDSRVSFPVVGLAQGKHTIKAQLYAVDDVLIHEVTTTFYVALPDTTPPAKPRIIKIERIR